MSDYKGEGSEKSKSNGISFPLHEIFPDAKAIFATEPLRIDQVKSDSLIFLDTNILLLPYEFDKITFSKIVEIYKILSKNNRIIIPGHAAREFAKHRAEKIRSIISSVQSQAGAIRNRNHKRISFLIGKTEYDTLVQDIDDFHKSSLKLAERLDALGEYLAGPMGTDPVSEMYRALFANAVRDIDLSDSAKRTAFQAELTRRYESGRPPGYKDKSKQDGGPGDLIIWKTIIDVCKSEKKHAIFVTAEEKSDWWTKMEGRDVPRFELAYEFQAETGKSFHILNLTNFLSLFNAEINIVNEVRRVETEIEKNYSNRSLYFDSEISELAENEKILKVLHEEREMLLMKLAVLLDGQSLESDAPQLDRSAFGMMLRIHRNKSQIKSIEDAMLKLREKLGPFG